MYRMRGWSNDHINGRIANNPPPLRTLRNAECPVKALQPSGRFRYSKLGGLLPKCFSLRGPAVSIETGLPQCGHLPEVMPMEAATGIPQLGQVPVFTWSVGPATQDGL